MSYKHLILLAPCHGMEDFPLYHTGDDAGSLLACWTALWHPLLLHSAEAIPRIERCEYPPAELADTLLVLPTSCDSELDPDLPKNAEEQNATLIRGCHQRAEILRLALERYGDAAAKLNQELVRDFLSFGYVYLQIEVLTQQMRYSSTVDQSRIERAIKAAAAALVENNESECREKLTAAHDALADERSHYYPVEMYLVDLTMVAPVETTMGKALENQLRESTPQNILASGKTIETLARSNPAALELLRDGVRQSQIGVAGGEYDEQPLNLMSFNAALKSFQRGLSSYQQHLGARPWTFARRRSGIYPELARVLLAAGFKSAIHMKFDEGNYPQSAQGKTKWSLAEQGLLDCYAHAPLDASLNETFLNFPSSLSDTMDTDHVATRMFIHWPGHVCPYYHDLRRAARYGNALGTWVTLETYFADSGDSGSEDTFLPSSYSYPFLQQAVDAGQDNPLSKWTEHWRDEIAAMDQGAIQTMANLLSPADRSKEQTELESSKHNLQQALCTRDATAGANASETSGGQSMSRTIVNAFSFPRRILLSHEDCPSLAKGSKVYATARDQQGYSALVDVPAMGFACIEFDQATDTALGPDLIEDLTLRNEFFQATVDNVTGALRSLKDYKSRNTRISQQVAFRITLPKTGQHWVDRQAPVGYSVMAADSVEVTRNGKILGEITAKGRMLALNGEQVGGFVQRYQVQRGSRVLVIEAEIEVQEDLLLADPWDSYYAFRFAFKDETAVMRAGTRLQIHDVSKRRITAPLCVDIDSGNQHTTILSGGLPYHRRVKDAQLDTIISVLGEKQRKFRIGIGVDLPSISRAAIDFLSPPTPQVLHGAAASESGWLFHFDAKNVVAADWQAIPGDGGEVGFTVRLVETTGRGSEVHLRAFKPIKSANVVNACGSSTMVVPVKDGVAEFRVAPYDVLQLRCVF